MTLTEILFHLLSAAKVTILVTLLSMTIATCFALFIALARISDNRIIWLSSTIYVEFMRGTPLVLQLFFLYFVGPFVGLRLDALTAGIIGLSLNYAAYISEVFRSSIQAVPHGQIEAASALGLSRLASFVYVIFPQATKIAIPPIGNYLIAMFKDTALLAIISVEEVMFTAQQLASTTFLYLPIFTVAFLIYLVISYPASLAMKSVERWLNASNTR